MCSGRCKQRASREAEAEEVGKSQPGKNGLCIYLGRLLISAESHHTGECRMKGKAWLCSGSRWRGNTNESCSASPECKPMQKFRS